MRIQEGCESDNNVEWKKKTKRSISASVNADGTHILRGFNHITDSDNKSKPNPQLMMVLQVKKNKKYRNYIWLYSRKARIARPNQFYCHGDS